MGAPECGGRDMPQAASTAPTGAQSGLGGSPLRAAGGQLQRCVSPASWDPDVKPDQDLSPAVDSEDKSKRREALGFGIWDPRPRPGNPSTLGRLPALSSDYLISTLAPASSTFFL